MGKPAAVVEAVPELATLSIRCPLDLHERARNAVWGTPGLTLTALASSALSRELDRLERAHGGPFADRHGVELTRGRRPQ